MPDLPSNLGLLTPDRNRDTLRDIRRGIEKESLRVTASGQLATTDHSALLGSALTHPAITTDYSEALLEFITPPSTAVREVLDSLCNIHAYTYAQIGEEMLWVNSMPCVLVGDENIPVARYGRSNIGRMKTIYRLGLGHRYGRSMQTIAGIHYNWSLPDTCWQLLRQAEDSSESLQAYKTRRYFDLIRNFRRHSWLLIYLFGASPVVCKSFVAGRPHRLVQFGEDEHSLHTPYATSLRMGDLGYQSQAQGSLVISYNSLRDYLHTLRQALTREYPAYEKLGLRDREGNYQQLSTSLLQVENEFYSTIRPKRTTASGETQFKALSDRGVEYIEVRCIDLNPMLPVGINARQIRFLDVFLLHCLLAPSPKTNAEEYRQILSNQRDVVYQGRNPELCLHGRQGSVSLPAWGRALMDEMQPVAALLDTANDTDAHSLAIAQEGKLLQNPQLTPSARILAAMAASKFSYFQLALTQAQEHRQYFLDRGLDPQVEKLYRHLAQESLQAQQQIEAGDDKNFEQFLADYHSQYRLPRLA